jgi:hypothetical protein
MSVCGKVSAKGFIEYEKKFLRNGCSHESGKVYAVRSTQEERRNGTMLV